MYWVSLFNSRGHAGSEAKKNPSKRIVEQSILENWRIAARAALGLDVKEVSMNAQEPPDAYATIKGSRVAVELTELVNGELLSALKQATKETGVRVTSSHGLFFEQPQWTEARFLAEVEKCVIKKQSNYERSGKLIDYLVISTAENWLRPSQVEQWLDSWAPPNAPNLRNIHLLMAYAPGWTSGHPVFAVKQAD